MNGTIFDIKEFTVHDGPGSRITVFLKGCPLRCKWCHNPEGLCVNSQLMYKEAFCSHCGACLRPCEHEECKPFGRCIHKFNSILIKFVSIFDFYIRKTDEIISK